MEQFQGSMVKYTRFALTAAIIGLFAGCGSGEGSDRSQEHFASSEKAGGILPKIVNGTVLSKDDLPPVNQIVTTYPDGSQGTCTSTFINPYQAITAAHCVLGAPANGVVAFLSSGYQGAIQSARVDVYPGYVPDRQSESDVVSGLPVFLGDIAIVTFREAYIGPIAAISAGGPTEGEEVIIAGYGKTSNSSSIDGELRAGTTTVEAVSYGQGFIFWQFDSFFESNICNGDSGGPSFVVEGDYLALTGIHSAIVGGCEWGGIAEDTMISVVHYLDWILDVTNSNIAVL